MNKKKVLSVKYLITSEIVLVLDYPKHRFYIYSPTLEQIVRFKIGHKFCKCNTKFV